MCRTSTVRSAGRTMLLALALALLPGLAQAQEGRITGTVTSLEQGPISGAQVSIVGTRIGTMTNPQGQFVITGVPAGAHQLQVSYTGYGTIVTDVTVGAGAAARVDVVLQEQAIALGGVVVSASRRAQRITDAPATITKVDAEVIGNSVGNTWVGALKEVKGLDYVQVGMTAVALNARGFNSSFNNRMLMMEDGRIAVLPENGLPVGSFTAVPKVDLAGIEVLVGPGAALYGADASSGVITLQSKDPRQYPGTTVEVTGGNHAYKDVQARHAGVIGNWGYKVAGEWQDAEDFSNFLPYTITVGKEKVVVAEDQMGANSIDWRSNVVRGTGSLVRYFEDGRLEFSAGASETDGVGQTNVGRNQLKNWGYNFLQAQFSNRNWYLNAYRAQSTSGESFALNRYADAYARNPDTAPEELRLASDWPSDGRMYAAEIQNNFAVSSLLDTHVTWGAQYRRDRVSSDREWLTDRLTGEDIEIDQFGVYTQTETPLGSKLDLVLAARMDNHENYDTQFSPKAALVFKPVEDQALRVSYNRAFKAPTTLQTNFFIPDWTPVVTIFGNTEGFTIKNAEGEVVSTVAPLQPEENRTWEMGYKGVFGGKMFVDVAGYYSNYENFLSPLSIIGDPFGLGLAGNDAGVPWLAYNADDELIQSSAGITPLVLTYYNLGAATIYGTDAGVNYYVTPRVKLKGTFSWVEMGDVEVPENKKEATALNSPSTKWTVGADFTDVGSFLDGEGNFLGGFTLRHVDSYYFRSGINTGVIPTFTTLDLNLGYEIPRFNTTFNVGLSNLFTCSQDDEAPFEYADTDALRTTPTNEQGTCGFGLRHQEMINMPQIGTMVFVGMRYHMQ